MSFDLAKKLLNLFADLGAKNVILIGGEPTLYAHLIDVIKYARQVGVAPIIITNGVRFSNITFLREVVNAGISDITIFLKAPDGRGYNRFIPGAGDSTFVRVSRAFENIRSLGAGVNLSVTLFREMSKSLGAWVDTIKVLKPNSISIDMGSPVIEGEEVVASDLLNPEELAHSIEYLQMLLRDSNLRYGFYVTIPLCLIDRVILDEIIKQDRVLTTCHVTRGSGLVFTPDGHVILCNHLASKPIGQYGVDFSTIDEFNRFWEGTGMCDIRSECSCYPHQKCQRCDLWDKCGGGCIVKWLHWNPDSFIH